MTNFTDLGLSAPILKALKGEGYATPTPIQAKAIPAILAGSDLLGIAQTGTGKTAAFALPILHRLAANSQAPIRKGCRVLVLSPTRELASQIALNFKTYGRDLGLSVAVVFGGASPQKQIRALARGVDILIATPGRLLDHVGQGNIKLDGTEVLVLDEADQLLDLGFLKPIKRIVSRISARRQTLFFSATMPQAIAGLAREFLRDPVKVMATPVSSTVERIAQRIIHIERNKKRAMLTDLLAGTEMSRALVFTRTKHGADKVAKHLDSAGISVAAIHGNKSQHQRERALSAFRNAKIRVLVATDIAARGIDVDDVSHVVNFDLPETPEAYVHRIGRTARAGASGSAISLCDSSERGQVRAIERLTRQSIPTENRCNDASLVSQASEPDRNPDRNKERRGRKYEPTKPRGKKVNGEARFDSRGTSRRKKAKKRDQDKLRVDRRDDAVTQTSGHEQDLLEPALGDATKRAHQPKPKKHQARPHRRGGNKPDSGRTQQNHTKSAKPNRKNKNRARQANASPAMV